MQGLIKGLDLVGREVGQHACQITRLGIDLLQSTDEDLQVGIEGVGIGLTRQVALALL